MPLSGANILDINSSPPNGTVTDTAGKFRLIAEIGRITIKITYQGPFSKKADASYLINAR